MLFSAMHTGFEETAGPELPRLGNGWGHLSLLSACGESSGNGLSVEVRGLVIPPWLFPSPKFPGTEHWPRNTLLMCDSVPEPGC